jgi:hypothetical protein
MLYIASTTRKLCWHDRTTERGVNQTRRVLLMGAKTQWLMNLVVVALLTAAPASAQSTSSELLIQLKNALSEVCEIVDYATTIQQGFHSLGTAVKNISPGIAATPTRNQLGNAGEDFIRGVLDRGGFDYREQFRFSDYMTSRERRGEFIIQAKDRGRIIIEVKNKERFTRADLRQILDYRIRKSQGDHLFLVVHPRTKVSRPVGRYLDSGRSNGFFTVVQCAFSLP